MCRCRSEAKSYKSETVLLLVVIKMLTNGGVMSV